MSDSFVGELCDQFLVCRMCSEDYKRPKTLSCLHTFCESCLEMHYEMEEQDRPYRFLMYTRALSCPLCRTKTELPTGGIHRLPDNFLLASLGEVVNRRRPQGGASKCEICTQARSKTSQGRWDGWDGDLDDNDDSSSKRTAVTKCLDCVKLLCLNCAQLHRQTKVTQQHTLFDLDIQKDIECKIHENEMLKFYCEECQACVCVLCTFKEHQDHDVSTLVDGGQKHRGNFEKMLKDCGKRENLLREQLETIDKFESEMMHVESYITDTAIEAIATVRRREKALISDLRDKIGERALQFVTKKNNLKEILKDAEQASGMTEVLLKGSSIDLLLAKKEMEQRLNSVLSVRPENIPDNLKRDLVFSSDEYYKRVKEYMNSGNYNTQTNGDSNPLLQMASRDTKTTSIQTDNISKIEMKSAEIQTNKLLFVDVSAGSDTEMMLENDETESLIDNERENDKISAEKEIDANPPIEAMSLGPMSPVQLISPIEYVTPMSKDEEEKKEVNKPSDSAGNTPKVPRSNIAQNWQESVMNRTSIAASQDSMLTTPPSTPTGSVKSLKEIFGTQQEAQSELDGSIGAPVTAKLIKPQAKSPVVMIDTGTEMEKPQFKDSSTGMSSVTQHHKQVGTPYIHTTSKFVWTDNLGMMDKSTMTTVDVTAAYRSASTTKRLVTVSRGTCTPRAMFPLDRATSPVIWTLDDDDESDQPSTHLTVPQAKPGPNLQVKPNTGAIAQQTPPGPQITSNTQGTLGTQVNITTQHKPAIVVTGNAAQQPRQAAPMAQIQAGQQLIQPPQLRQQLPAASQQPATAVQQPMQIRQQLPAAAQQLQAAVQQPMQIRQQMPAAVQQPQLIRQQLPAAVPQPQQIRQQLPAAVQQPSPLLQAQQLPNVNQQGARPQVNTVATQNSIQPQLMQQSPPRLGASQTMPNNQQTGIAPTAAQKMNPVQSVNLTPQQNSIQPRAVQPNQNLPQMPSPQRMPVTVPAQSSPLQQAQKSSVTLPSPQQVQGQTQKQLSPQQNLPDKPMQQQPVQQQPLLQQGQVQQTQSAQSVQQGQIKSPLVVQQQQMQQKPGLIQQTLLQQSSGQVQQPQQMVPQQPLSLAAQQKQQLPLAAQQKQQQLPQSVQQQQLPLTAQKPPQQQQMLQQNQQQQQLLMKTAQPLQKSIQNVQKPGNADTNKSLNSTAGSQIQQSMPNSANITSTTSQQIQAIANQNTQKPLNQSLPSQALNIKPGISSAVAASATLTQINPNNAGPNLPLYVQTNLQAQKGTTSLNTINKVNNSQMSSNNKTSSSPKSPTTATVTQQNSQPENKNIVSQNNSLNVQPLLTSQPNKSNSNQTGTNLGQASSNQALPPGQGLKLNIGQAKGQPTSAANHLSPSPKSQTNQSPSQKSPTSPTGAKGLNQSPRPNQQLMPSMWASSNVSEISSKFKSKPS